MIKKISFIILSLVLISLMIVSCKEKEVIYNIGDEVTIDGIKYKLYSTSELGYNREYFKYFFSNQTKNGYFNPDGTLKNINEEDIYKKNDDRVGYLHKFYYYDMLNLDKYPDLTVELIQDTYKNKNIHNYYGTSTYCDYRNLAEVYPCQFLYIDDNGLPQNYENYVYSTSFIYDYVCKDEAYWAVVGYNYDDVKEDTLILHRIGDYQIVAIAYKALEGAPMKTLTVEAPTDEDLKEDKDGNYSYIPVLYYPYAISNCPNLVSISTFNGYFMPLSISNIPNQIDLNLASKEDEKRIGLFALDAAFYKLDIRYLTLNYLNQVNIQGTKIGQLIGDEIYGRSGLAGCFNLIFTDCDVKYLHNNYFGQLDHTGSPIYLADEKIVAMPSDHNEEYIIGIIPSKTVATPPDIVINYQFSGQILPRIKDGVCSQPYNDYMLNKYKDKSKTVLFPKFNHFMPYGSSTWKVYDYYYFVENGYVKIKLIGEFLTLRKCNHTDKYDIFCVSREYGVEEEVVLTLCKIDNNSTYLVTDGTIIYAKN